MNPHSYIKTRRLADDSNRLTTIDKENKELLKKINLINRSKVCITFPPLSMNINQLLSSEKGLRGYIQPQRLS